jgi:hypothetical protein
MDVKQVIECIKDRYDDVWLEGNCRIGQEELWRERDRVISLLQQGEAYRQMVKELEKNYGYYYWGSMDNLSQLIPRLEQKYFPKKEESNNEQN